MCIRDRVMLCSDVFPKGVDTPQFGFSRHRNAKPCVFQIGIKIQQIGALGKKQELMLWIFTDLCKYLVSPDVYKRQTHKKMMQGLI